MGAVDGPQALDAMHKNRPDLIILDKEMPEMNGDEVARTVKTDQELKNIPIIMISADVESLAETARVCGIGCFLPKPFEAEDLFEMIKTLLPHTEKDETTSEE